MGGDCSNAACVPSKALRSIARSGSGSVLEANDHALNTVMAIRKREDICNFHNATNLDLVLVESSKFVSRDEMEIVPRDTHNTTKRVRAKRFLVATGASPIVPSALREQALEAGLPLFTYRSILSPSENANWKDFCLEANASTTLKKHVVIAGGGPTAVELGQSLARLEQFQVTLVAPTTLLPDEDVSLQQSACQILRHDGATPRLGQRVIGVNATNKLVILDDGTELPADALAVCMGREPTVKGLDLDAAGIAWDSSSGVTVHPSSLRSTTHPRIFACGDCCSAVRGKDRKAAHAAWTGYHAIRNMGIPRILWAGSGDSIHSTVPSVTYADPELASVGLTRSECIEKYGQEGFDHLAIREEGMDRADMERQERFVGPCFVELRAVKRTGHILGLTTCGPAAAELANEVGLAIQSKLTVRDLARSIHAYPSHGYLLYRLALSMALLSVRGFLDVLGTIPRLGGRVYGGMSAVVTILHPGRMLPWKRAKRHKQRQWEAVGQQRVFVVPVNENSTMATDSLQCYAHSLPVSFLEFYKSEQYEVNDDLPEAFEDWLKSKPH